MSEGQDKYVARVPENESDRYSVVYERKGLWEYALFGSVLLDQLRLYEPEWRDYEVGYVSEIGAKVSLSDVPDFMSDMIGRSQKIVKNFNKLLSGEAFTRAVGEPGESGNPLLIEHLARRIIDIYGDMISWAAQMRGARVPEEAERLQELLALYVDTPLRRIREFVPDYVSRMNDIMAQLAVAVPTTPIELTMTILLEIPEETSTAAMAELERVGELIRAG